MSKKKNILFIVGFIFIAWPLYYFNNNYNITDNWESGYFVKSGKVYYDRHCCWFWPSDIGADVKSFKYIWEWYARDKDSVYKLDNKLKWINPDNFKIVWGWYFKDDKYTYRFDDTRGVVIIKSDYSTFAFSNKTGFDYDKNWVYLNGRLFFPWADWESFQRIWEYDTNWYKDKNKVFYVYPFPSREVIVVEWIDVTTAKTGFNRNVIVDSNSVFFQGKKIEWASPVWFSCYGFDCTFSKDENSVFFWNKKINADILTFTYNQKSWFSKDKFASFDNANWSRIEQVSTNDLRKITGNYYISGNKVYYLWEIIEWADANSVKSFSWQVQVQSVMDNYIKDKNHVYYKGKIIDADASSIYVVWTGLAHRYERYLADKDFVYYEGKRIEGASPKNFYQDFTDYAIDVINKKVYYKWKVVEWADYKYFSYINGEFDSSYGKDKEHIYYGNILIKDADYATFHALSYLGFDKNHVYNKWNIWAWWEDINCKSYDSCMEKYKKNFYY